MRRVLTRPLTSRQSAPDSLRYALAAGYSDVSILGIYVRVVLIAITFWISVNVFAEAGVPEMNGDNGYVEPFKTAVA